MRMPPNNALELEAPRGKPVATAGCGPAAPSRTGRRSSMAMGGHRGERVLRGAVAPCTILLALATSLAGGSRPLAYEVPPGFRGWIRIEFGVKSCPWPDDGHDASLIVVSKEGRACSRLSRGASVRRRAVVRYANRKTRLPEAPQACCEADPDWEAAFAEPAGATPRERKRGRIGRDVVLAWWDMGWTCEDLHREVQSLFVGNVDEFKGSEQAETNCRPTPWP